MMAIRKSIESDFSLLSYYNAENNRARSPVGFQQRLEIAILAYNMACRLERFNSHHASQLFFITKKAPLFTVLYLNRFTFS